MYDFSFPNISPLIEQSPYCQRKIKVSLLVVTKDASRNAWRSSSILAKSTPFIQAKVYSSSEMKHPAILAGPTFSYQTLVSSVTLWLQQKCWLQLTMEHYARNFWHECPLKYIANPLLPWVVVDHHRSCPTGPMKEEETNCMRYPPFNNMLIWMPSHQWATATRNDQKYLARKSCIFYYKQMIQNLIELTAENKIEPEIGIPWKLDKGR